MFDTQHRSGFTLEPGNSPLRKFYETTERKDLLFGSVCFYHPKGDNCEDCATVGIPSCPVSYHNNNGRVMKNRYSTKGVFVFSSLTSGFVC